MAPWNGSLPRCPSSSSRQRHGPCLGKPARPCRYRSCPAAVGYEPTTAGQDVVLRKCAFRQVAPRTVLECWSSPRGGCLRRGRRLASDRPAMLTLPPIPPHVGWVNQIRLGRDYYVRVDSSAYPSTRRRSAARSPSQPTSNVSRCVSTAVSSPTTPSVGPPHDCH